MRREIKQFSVRAIHELLLLFVICCLLFTIGNAAFRDTGWGARSSAMGGVGTSICDDAVSPMLNPAGGAQIKDYEASFFYERPFYGLDLKTGKDDSTTLKNSYFSMIIPTLKGSFGFSFMDFYTSNLYRESTYLLNYSNKIKKFAKIPFYSGVNLKFLTHKYFLDERTKIDPVFREGRKKGAVTLDWGFLFIPISNLKIGFVMKNLTQPDVGLMSKDKVPLEIKFGSSYKVEAWNFLNAKDMLFGVDFSYRNQEWGNTSDRTNIHWGVESWFFKKLFAFRFGGNFSQISTGFGFNFNKLYGIRNLRLNYAFIWPFYIEGSVFNHKISLNFSFSGKEEEK